MFSVFYILHFMVQNLVKSLSKKYLSGCLNDEDLMQNLNKLFEVNHIEVIVR